MQIIILGMHRSGTSALSRLLNMMGAYLGPEEVLIPVSANNPKGYWEREDVLALNEELLQAAGASWCRLSGFSDECIPDEAVRRFGRSSKQLINELDAHQPWVLKDPRLCLLLRTWRAVLDAPVCVHIVRNPIEVARSLRERNGFPLHVSIALWEKYNRSALAVSEGLPRLLVTHDEIVYEPIATVRRLHAELAALGVHGITVPPADEVEAFIDKRLHRQREQSGVEGQFLNAEQVALWTHLADRSALDLVPTSNLSAGAIDALRHFERHEQEVADLQDRLEAVGREAESEREQHQQSIEQLQRERDEDRSEIKRLREMQGRGAHLFRHSEQVADGFRAIDRTLVQISNSKRYLFGHVVAECFNRIVPDPLKRLLRSIARTLYMRIAANFPRLRVPTFPEIHRLRMDMYRILSAARHESGPSSAPVLSGNRSNGYLPAASQTTAPGFETVSVVSAVYNKADTLERFVAAFAEQTFGGLIQIVLIDDASVDSSGEVIRQIQEKYKSHDRLQILSKRNSQNLGNCGSRNIGLRHAAGDAILVMDADCIVNRAFVESHVQVHRSGFDVCIGPMGIESRGRPVEQLLDDLDRDRSLVQQESKLQHPEEPDAFVNCVTRNFSITRDLLENLDMPLFDESFAYRNAPDTGFGWEDVEMGSRLFRRGASVGFSESAISVHLTHPPEVPDAVKMLGSLRNFNRLLQKHPDLPSHQQQWTARTAGKLVAWAGRSEAGTNDEVQSLLQSIRGRSEQIRRPSNRVVVYSAIAGGYDCLEELEEAAHECDYFCFHDDAANVEVPPWTLLEFDELFDDPCLTAKKPKILPHVFFPEYEWSVWIDGNILPRAEILSLVEEVEQSGCDIGLFRHPERDCLYQEAARCVARSKDLPEVIFSQVSRYEEEGFPQGMGLAECNVLIRRHNAAHVRRVMCGWWREIRRGSKRDQLSFNYVAWKHGLKYAELASGRRNVRNDRRFHYREHGSGAIPVLQESR